MVDVRTVGGSDAASIIATLPSLVDIASVSQLQTRFDCAAWTVDVVDAERKYIEMKELLTALKQVRRAHN